MRVARGLIIADPWIDHILEGRKDWEMRSQATAHRGWFGLIRKGSGRVVGLARLVECGKALNFDEMIASHPHHQIPESMIRSGTVSKWVIPWKLSDITPLARPIPYEHKSGAVTWVTFSDDVSRQLQEFLKVSGFQSDNDKASPDRTMDRQHVTKLNTAPNDPAWNKTRAAPTRIPPVPEPAQSLLGRTRIRGAKLRNQHFYLTEFLDKFPADTIGGRNKHEAAPREITVDWGGPSPVTTDIDLTKRMFRKRGWVREFFSASNAREGDVVVLTSSTPYHIQVRIERAVPG